MVVGAAAAHPDLRLVNAAKDQDPQQVRTLLSGRPDVNIRSEDGSTALLWAAHWNDLQTAKLLVRAGADANAANDFRMTPLAQACTNGNAEFVDLLLKAGANPNTPIGTGETPLMTCARTGSADAVRMLLVHGADVNAKEPNQNQTALMWAAAQQHPKVLADPDRGRRADLQAHTKAGFTALHFAARAGDMESTRTLLDAGVDVNIKSQPDMENGRGQGPAAAGTGTGDRRRCCRARAGWAAAAQLSVAEPARAQAQTLPAARRCSSRRCEARCRSRCSCWITGQIPTSLMRGLLRFIGRRHVGKRTGEPRLWVCRSDRRHSGSRSEAAARQGAAGARREPESADDGPSTGIRRHRDRWVQRRAWRDARSSSPPTRRMWR